MTLDPDCVSVRIDNSAASANSLHCKIMLAVKSVLNCSARGRVMEGGRQRQPQRIERKSRKGASVRERKSGGFSLCPVCRCARCEPAAVLHGSHHLLTAILKQEGTASRCV